MKRPAFQFYPSDWLSDTALRSCSIGARGLWIEIICYMHEAHDYGYLKVNSRVVSDMQLARMVGEPIKHVKVWLAELEDAGVFSRDDDGVIYSRRMVRDEELREARAKGGNLGAKYGALGAEHGIKGGRPKLNKGALKTPLTEKNLPPINPPPSSSSSSSKEKTFKKENFNDEVLEDAPVAPSAPNRAAPMPHDWQPNQQSVIRAKELGFTGNRLDDQIRAFKQHQSNQGVHRNWDERFIGWLGYANGRNTQLKQSEPVELFIITPDMPEWGLWKNHHISINSKRAVEFEKLESGKGYHSDLFSPKGKYDCIVTTSKTPPKVEVMA